MLDPHLRDLPPELFEEPEPANPENGEAGAEAGPGEEGSERPKPSFDDEVFDRMARMKPSEYDRLRREEAERLKIRTSTLDEEVKKRRRSPKEDTAGQGSEVEFPEIKPWEHPVDGAELFGEIAQFVRRFVILGAHDAAAVALWAAHAHAHDLAAHSPVLAITSPEWRCGKTTLLSVIERLVPRALPMANITTAAVFRAVEKWRPSMLIDEADTFLEGDELRGVLNSGHNRRTAFVIRTCGDDHDPRRFTTWAPKTIAMIGKLPGTLADRSVEVRLQRKLPKEKVDRFARCCEEEAHTLARKLVRFVRDNASKLDDADPSMPDGLHDRAADNWRQLIAIADAAGGEWPARARAAAQSLSGLKDNNDAVGAMLLADIKDYFDGKNTEGKKLKLVKSRELACHLGELETRPWPEMSGGKPITPTKLAKLLAPFNVKPTKMRFVDGTDSGYDKETFTDAFTRYL